MPTYDLYRETTTREHYKIKAETPEAAFAIYEEGDAHVSNDEVIDAQPVTVALDGTLVLDTATLAIDEDEAEPERETFTCKIGVNARAYFDIELDGINADEVLDNLRDLNRTGMLIDRAANFEYELSDDEEAVVIQVRDESGNDCHELVPLDYEPFDEPPAIVNYVFSGSTFDQFSRLRSMLGNLIDDNDKDERKVVRKIIDHLEAKLSPATYSQRIHRAAALKSAIDEAGKKAVERFETRLAP